MNAPLPHNPLPSPEDSSTLPSPADWSEAAIRLLQGVVYHDEGDSLWNSILQHASLLREYFGKLGLLLVIDDTDAMAYLQQIEPDDLAPNLLNLPRLFRRIPLSYETTLLCVLLRDELRQFEEADLQNDRCVILQSELLPIWSAFFPEGDEVKRQRALAATLRKLEELKFVKLFDKAPPSWEVRRIIKARLPISSLLDLRQSLLDELQRRQLGLSHPTSDSNPAEDPSSC